MADTLSPVQELTEFHYQISHEMFVPKGTLVTPHELGSFVLNTYAEASIQRNEDLDAMLIGDAFRFLPLSMEDIVIRAEHHGIGSLAQQTLEQVNRETNEQIDEAVRRVRHLPADKHLLAASDVLAQDAHEGEFRKSGKPYYTHVFRVAAMGFDVARKLEAEGLRDDPARTTAEIILREHHDAPEETMPAGKHYNPNREGHFSPLLIFRLMERYDNPYARETADALRLITHLKGMPWMRTWPEYVHQRVMQSLMATQGKDDDRDDNLRNEDKPSSTPDDAKRRRNKCAEYELLGPMLKARALELAPTPEDRAWIWRSNGLRAHAKPGLKEDEIKALGSFIYEEAA